MKTIISTTWLTRHLGDVVERTRKGERILVTYRGRVAFEIIPQTVSLADDPLYKARALGRSTDGKSSADHDEIIYGK